MSDATLHDLILATPATIAAIAGLLSHWRISSLSLHINSKMDAYIEAVKDGALAQGRAAGVEAERVRRADVQPPARPE